MFNHFLKQTMCINLILNKFFIIIQLYNLIIKEMNYFIYLIKRKVKLVKNICFKKCNNKLYLNRI